MDTTADEGRVVLNASVAESTENEPIVGSARQSDQVEDEIPQDKASSGLP